eukprot:gene7585-788_t
MADGELALALAARVAAPRLPLPLDKEEFAQEIEGIAAAQVRSIAEHVALAQQRRLRDAAEAQRPYQRGGYWPSEQQSHGERHFLSPTDKDMARVASALLDLCHRFGSQLGCVRKDGVWRVPICLSAGRDGPLAVLLEDLRLCLSDKGCDGARFTAVVGDAFSKSVTISLPRPSGALDWGIASIASAVRLRAPEPRFESNPDAVLRLGLACVAADLSRLEMTGCGQLIAVLFDDNRRGQKVEQADALRTVCDAADKAAATFDVDAAKCASYDEASGGDAVPRAAPLPGGGVAAAGGDDGGAGGRERHAEQPPADGGAAQRVLAIYEARLEEEQRLRRREEEADLYWSSVDDEGVSLLGSKDKWRRTPLSRVRRKIRSAEALAWCDDLERALNNPERFTQGNAVIAARLKRLTARSLQDLGRIYPREEAGGGWSALSRAEAVAAVPDARRRHDDYDAACALLDLGEASALSQKLTREFNLLPSQSGAVARHVLSELQARRVTQALCDEEDLVQGNAVYTARWEEIERAARDFARRMLSSAAAGADDHAQGGAFDAGNAATQSRALAVQQPQPPRGEKPFAFPAVSAAAAGAP